MLKKRYLVIAALTLLTVTAAGCGKQNSVIQVTPTPTATAEVTPTAAADLVEMEEIDDTNIMGDKTTTATKLTVVNRTGSDIAAFYVREHPSAEEEDDADWGDDLINGTFTLKNGDSASYYYEKTSAKSTADTAGDAEEDAESEDAEESSATASDAKTYDIRITYTEEGKNECFFRDLPLTTMKQITLRMSGTDEDAFPYATYTTNSSSKEFSTMSAVKKRLGLDDSDDEDEDDETESTPTPTPENDDSNNSSVTPQPTTSPSDGGNSDSNSTTAESYIGKSVSSLIGAIGSAEYSEYDEDGNQGKTGYYYYNNFTVSTTIDADGNEVVSGVW